jgi:hypothetical protein
MAANIKKELADYREKESENWLPPRLIRDRLPMAKLEYY